MTDKCRTDFEGVWSLLHREDLANDGSTREEDSLGADALGTLSYANGRFAVQIMRRDRTSMNETTSSAADNTQAVNGYDAFFGTYQIDGTDNGVEHTLEGALSAENIGMKVLRRVCLEDDQLVIRVETTTPAGEPVTRVLTWERVA